MIAANIQAAPNSPVVCSIQIPPLAEGTRLLPRTLVHLFFLDFYAAASPNIYNRGPLVTPGTSKSPTAYQLSRRSYDEKAEDGQTDDGTIKNVLSDLGNENYKLLFGGEVVGFQWSKNQSQRSLVLQCEDFSNYWDYAYQFNNTDIFGPGIKAVFSGGATNLFTDFLSTQGSVLTAIVSSGKCATFPKMEGLAAGLIRLVESIGGTFYPKASADGVPGKKVAGQNIFFSLAELRLHITQMITAIEDDPTSKRLISRNGYSGYFDRLLGGQGGQVSIRQAMNAISGVMFYETYGQPCPMYKPGKDGSIGGVGRAPLIDDTRLGFIAVTAKDAVFGLSLVKAGLADLVSNPTSLSKVAAIKNVSSQINGVRRTLNSTQAQMGRAPERLKSWFSQAGRSLAAAAQAMRSWGPKAPETTQQKVTNKLDEAIAQLTSVVQFAIPTTKAKDSEPAILQQQILRPDIWFTSPPRCNVLFPENYYQLDYQRTFLKEPTRFLLKTNDEFFGEDMLFDKFFFAPTGNSLKKGKADLQGMLRNDLLDHELFTGILPVFEKMGEFNIFAAAAGQSSIVSKKGQPKTLNPTTPANSTEWVNRATASKTGPTDKIGYAQRSTNFLYFKHRFNSRQMNITGKFNPYIACGFPGLVMDKYVDEASLKVYNELRATKGFPQVLAGQALGTNFLGNFTQVSHSVSQSESRGTTSIGCSFPRQAEESVEFLGSVDRDQKVRKRFGTDALRSTDVAAASAPKLFSLGPNFGRITDVVDVTAQYQGGGADFLEPTGRSLPLFAGESRRKGYEAGKSQKILVPIGVPVSGNSLGSHIVGSIIGDPNIKVVFKAYKVTEEIPKYRAQVVDLPAEAYITPGWYGDVWSPSKVGQAYGQFFGTGSINDPQQVADPGGSSTGAINQEAEDALATRLKSDGSYDAREDAPAILALDSDTSIQQAVEFLVSVYSYIKASEMDAEEFIRAYTWRPIASMVDMLGTSDLKFSDDGSSVISGFEGFHSKAFGPYDDLFGLVTPEIDSILNIARGSVVAQRGDTRGRKFHAVQQLVAAMLFSRAILG